MKYIYKLIDLTEKELADRGLVSLSHPIFKFKGSEGKILDWAKSVFDDYNKYGLNLQPRSSILEKIRKWVEAYRISYGRPLNNLDLLTESRVMFCVFMNHFCGYYTSINLFNNKQLAKYLKLNNNSLPNKKYVLRIAIDDDVFQKSRWKSNSKELIFERNYESITSLNGIVGYLSIFDVEYIPDAYSYQKLLEIYNKEDWRSAITWYNFLPEKFNWQKEIRLIFALESLNKNQALRACDRVYNIRRDNLTIEEQLFCFMVDSIHYAKNHDDYACLKLSSEKIKIKKIEEDSFYEKKSNFR